jgi:acetyl-CoA carboxylase biotin carboxyl carrier protein
MPEPTPPRDRTPAERQADHEGLARLSESLVPALVQKLNASALGELEIREGEWRIRLRRHHATAQRRDRSRLAASGGARQPAAVTAAAAPGASDAGHDPRRAVATSPAVGVFRAIATVGSPVRSGDRIAVVDLLGIAQDVVAPADGILAEIYAETGEAVEYGEELALIEVPSGNGTDGGGRHERDGHRNGDA